MSSHADFTSKNAVYAETFDKGHLSAPPAKKLLIVTCMDARIDCYKSLGLELGEVHVVRNAGGVVRDALRSIIISQRLLGTREIAVFHHTNCGMLSFTSPQLRDIIKSEAQSKPSDEREAIAKTVDSMEFHEFSDLEASVKADVDFLKEHALVLDETKVTGWLYDTNNGTVCAFLFSWVESGPTPYFTG
ncbi:carbonate dehydratase activity protein [Rhodocollybia butyracea]|uniref:Carbonic anhydrase n=1 Tax=Rhodocollybia butyracea TaxID=206335 RepID=A0A9P5P7A7_9AGAR|nr:carbonate dehydratase activity protein [Rhodocollybia butyracea]